MRVYSSFARRQESRDSRLCHSTAEVVSDKTLQQRVFTNHWIHAFGGNDAQAPQFRPLALSPRPSATQIRHAPPNKQSTRNQELPSVFLTANC